jgi:hypothetical protein
VKIRKRYVALAVLILAVVWLVFAGPRPGHVIDEAKQAGLTAAAFNPIEQVDLSHDYFHDMDRGVTLHTKAEVNGRNMWILWTGGNDRFWDTSSTLSFGNNDLLKTVSSYDPDKDSALDSAKREHLKSIYKSRRANRWDYLGAINEPCFREASGPDPKRYGLWLDQRSADCPSDPFEDETKYPGVRIGARGKNIPVGSYYGYASGVVGLRLFPNPAFDEAAAKKWDPERYYSDPSYYKSKDLIRPYRVGMSCGFCHIGPNPVHPPADPENPAWENLSSVVGAQYLWVDRVFSWESQPDNFVAQLFHTWRPGTVDVSFVSQDNIDNPRTMNAVYNAPARMQLAKRFGKEKLSESNRESLQLNHYVAADSPLAAFFQSPDTVYTMRVLKDGSDSIGVIAALNRVYLNIGLFSEEWLLHFRPMLGGQHVTPIEVKTIRKNSVYWDATEAQTFDMAAFLLAAGNPHLLSDVAPSDLPAPDSPAAPEASLELGKRAFADRCERCHSSKLPQPPAGADPGNCSGNYLDCWNRYWRWTQTDDYRTKARIIVAQPDFLKDNYLSTDLRVPITLLQTNACSSLATNAIAGNVWDNFSSDTYKSLPAVGSITYYQPFSGEKRTYNMPGGGRGYIRPASLVSLWSTAPYLLNNSVGPFYPSPSVASRLKAFQISITQMLWPETRDKDELLGPRIPGKIDRTTAPSYVRIPAGYLPGGTRPFLGMLATLMPGVFNSGPTQPGVVIGPIPAGMPVELLANLQLTLDGGGTVDQLKLDRELASAVLKFGSAVNEARGKSDEEARRIVFSADVVDPLMKVSKCPDYVVNRGHYFGAEGVDGEAPLSNEERAALIGFLKSF